MLYLIQSLYIGDLRTLRVLKYISVRAALAFFIAFMFMILLGKPFINYLKKIKIQDTVREDGPSHSQKNGTPTMGGLLIVASILFSTFIAGNFGNKYVIFLFFITILLTCIGFYDDYLKLTKNKRGLSAKLKLLLQLIIVIITFIFIHYEGIVNKTIDYSLVNPFIKYSYLHVGPILFFVFMIFVIVGASNAVNLTDGLDGLVSGPLIIVFTTFMFIVYLIGNVKYATYLNLYYNEGAAEITVFIAAVIGGLLGFLWYNFFPAQIFMGDTGSLTFGGLLGIISIFIKQEFLLVIAGFIFIVEAVSVVLQVYVYKKYKKRLFKMAPIHHHFEKNMPETKVTIRFWIITIMTCLLAVVILKLR